MSYNKYYVYKKQYSNDGGTTWHDVEPIVTAPSGESIGRYDTLEECEGQLPYSAQSLTIVARDATAQVHYTTLYEKDIPIDYSIYDKNGTYVTGGILTHDSRKGIAVGQKMVLDNLSGKVYEGESYLNITGKANIQGNIASIVGSVPYPYSYSYTFSGLFGGSTGIISAENLYFPHCYGRGSCEYMFRGCTNMILPPKYLPSDGTSEETFYGMFADCTSLVKSPIIEATYIPRSCCYHMFQNCPSLTEITCLATSFYSTSSTSGWVGGVSSTGTFYKNPSMSSWKTGVSGIPSGWTVLDYTP